MSRKNDVGWNVQSEGSYCKISQDQWWPSNIENNTAHHMECRATKTYVYFDRSD